VAPVTASAATPEPGIDAFAESRGKKSKSARAAQKEAEKAAKREAKRAKKLEQEDPDDEGEEVVGSVNSQPARTRSSSRRGREDAPDEVIESAEKAASKDRGRRSSRRARNAVPDEVISAVERAVARERGRRDRETVTVEAEDGGDRRIYRVPREDRF
jgi:hypothetical protein